MVFGTGDAQPHNQYEYEYELERGMKDNGGDTARALSYVQAGTSLTLWTGHMGDTSSDT